jgi:hypothetical protein
LRIRSSSSGRSSADRSTTHLFSDMPGALKHRRRSMPARLPLRNSRVVTD